jgi:hypothetical protein
MKRLILFALVVALMASGPAYGQSALKGTYGGKGGVISSLSTAKPKSSVHPFTPSSSSKGSLPFTGLDLVLLAFGGVALVGVGMGVRRLSRPLA